MGRSRSFKNIFSIDKVFVVSAAAQLPMQIEDAMRSEVLFGFVCFE
jgi:hypothetical protein